MRMASGSAAKRITQLVAATALLLGAAPAASAQEAAQQSWRQAEGVDIPAIIRDNTYEIIREGEALAGPGVEFLLRETRNAQFVLLAEPHNTNEVNEFTAGLFSLLHDASGFRHLLLEQGPFIMDRFNEPAVRGDVKAIRAIARDYPHALHFGTDSELELFARVTAKAGADVADPLWGVDRVLSARIGLEALAASTEDAAARAEIADLIERARQHNRANVLKGASGRYMLSPAPEFDALLGELEAPPGSAGAFALRAVRVSRRDLRRWVEEHQPTDPWGYTANLERESLMKTQFADLYRSARRGGEPTPRVLGKLGHWHVGRGRNPGNVFSLGNHLSEVAAFHGMTTLTINIQPVNKPGQHWSITDYPEYSPVADVGDPDKWLLVDLRPLRGYVHAGLLRVSRELQDVIFGYDAALLMGGTTRGEATWQRRP